MNFHIDVAFENINKYGEELCGDKVEVIKSHKNVVAVLADGLGSGVKANILATLTSKIIATMLTQGSSIDEAVETITSTLPVCKERQIAYSTFTILKISSDGKGYIAEFDNPAALMIRNGEIVNLDRNTREINGKSIRESTFEVKENDFFVLLTDGVVHAGIGSTLNLGWQFENVCQYVKQTLKPEMSAKAFAKLLISVCANLYMGKPGDDSTVVCIKARKPVHACVLIGPPRDRSMDEVVIKKFVSQDGLKIICGGTTSQIYCRETGKKICTSFNYFNPTIPPTAEIEGINLVTEGVLTIGNVLDLARKYASSSSTMQDFLALDKQDGASRLAKLLLEKCTSIHFIIGRAINPAHQNPGMPLNYNMKLRLVEELAELLKSCGKNVSLEYW